MNLFYALPLFFFFFFFKFGFAKSTITTHAQYVVAAYVFNMYVFSSTRTFFFVFLNIIYSHLPQKGGLLERVARGDHRSLHRHCQRIDRRRGPDHLAESGSGAWPEWRRWHLGIPRHGE
jgi:hypothetical protein